MTQEKIPVTIGNFTVLTHINENGEQVFPVHQGTLEQVEASGGVAAAVERYRDNKISEADLLHIFTHLGSTVDRVYGTLSFVIPNLTMKNPVWENTSDD